MNRTVNFDGLPQFTGLFRMRPHAWASVRGSEAYPEVKGLVRFYETAYGALTVAELRGLPTWTGACDAPVFGFHIHEGGECTGAHDHGGDPFSGVQAHYDPRGCPHPYHAGDLPPIFGANGYAFSAFLSDRFTVREIVGRSVILHSAPDDFTSQPSGNSGERIACGEIRAGNLRWHAI